MRAGSLYNRVSFHRRGDLQLTTFNRQYVERLGSRDPETEQHFVTYFGPLLTAKLRTRLRSAEAIEDVRQDTLMRVLVTIRRDGGLNDPERLGAFVNGVCNNVLREFYRSKARHPQADENAPELHDYRPNPESEFVTEERKALVRTLIQELGGKERQLLSAVFVEDREKNEICQEMGVDTDYLRVLLHRARAKFKKALLDRVGKSAVSNQM